MFINSLTRSLLGKLFFLLYIEYNLLTSTVLFCCSWKKCFLVRIKVLEKCKFINGFGDIMENEFLLFSLYGQFQTKAKKPK